MPEKAPRKAVFQKAAAREFRDAKHWYRKEASVEVARAFGSDVQWAVQQIIEHPARWPIYEDTFRWIKLRQFPYLLVYDIVDEATLLIVVVAHERRAPGYWKGRA